MVQKLSMNLGLAQIPETQDQKLFGELYKVYNAIKNLAATVDTYTGALQQDQELWSILSPTDTIHSQNTNRLYVEYSEDVGLGEFVTLWNDAGTLKAKKAGGVVWAGDCRGYCSVGGGVTAGNFGEVILFGLHPLVAGATPGTLYYISNTTAGTITPTKPATSGNTIQPIGYALAYNILFFNPSLFTQVVP